MKQLEERQSKQVMTVQYGWYWSGRVVVMSLLICSVLYDY